MAKKLEVREGDYLTVRLPVRVARDGPLDNQIVTLELFGQRISGPLELAPVVKHEKGVNWPSDGWTRWRTRNTLGPCKH